MSLNLVRRQVKNAPLTATDHDSNLDKLETAIEAIVPTPGTDLTYDPATRQLSSSTGADTILPVATTSAAGLLSAADKTKLDQVVPDRAMTVLVTVRNATGAAIAKGTPVYVLGSNGTTVSIAPADASVEATAAGTLGLTQDAIPSNSTGYVVAVGELGGLNTSALTEGALVWLSETTGALTTTRPTQPAHGVVIGYCVKQGAGTSGIIYCKVDNGLELDELHDVLITGVATGLEVLRRGVDGLWRNATLTAADVGAISPYVHTQSTPSTTWTINHNLGFRPSVELLDSGSQEIDADVSHPSVNQTVVTLKSATAGLARLI